MTDEFDDFLARKLAPPGRDPDRAFVRRVQTRITLDQRLVAERSALLRGLAMKLGALAVLATGLLMLARAPALADLATDFPAVALAGVLAGFGLLVALLAAGDAQPSPGAPIQRASSLSMVNECCRVRSAWLHRDSGRKAHQPLN